MSKKFYTVCPKCNHKAPIENNDLIERQQVEIEWKLKVDNNNVKYNNNFIRQTYETYVFCLYCGEFTDTDIMSCIVEEENK